jgi:cytochrome P450 family 3 subfamily A
MYPKLFAMIGESLFVTKELKFFFELIENMMRERAQSEQVFYNLSYNKFF